MNPKNIADFLVPPSLTHLKRMTTKDGLVQHADFEVPDPAHGYSIDDNARALIVCAWFYRAFPRDEILALAKIYLNYISRAEAQGGKFHNFLDYLGDIPGQEESEDAFGRTVWALAEAQVCFAGKDIAEKAKQLLSGIIENEEVLDPIRSQAYLLLYYSTLGNTKKASELADRLVAVYETKQQADWQWFEECLYYANGILPYALSQASLLTGEQKYAEIAQVSFDWLDKTSQQENLPAPIGQNGWYCRGKDRSLFDQQPLEVADMVLAATSLHRLHREPQYLKRALAWINWYFGDNIQHASLWNPQTRGVYDAVTPAGVNENQGAESIVTFLMAYLSLSEIANEAS